MSGGQDMGFNWRHINDCHLLRIFLVGTDRLKTVVNTALESSMNVDAQELVDIVVDAVNVHTVDQPQFDDMTLFVIKRVRE